jgi:glycosyltransferase involved in cell wall biosynthesis
MTKIISYSVVVPAFAEEVIIENSLNQLASCLMADSDRFDKTEVVVVAADAGDKTAELSKKHQNRFRHFKLIEPGQKVGKGRDVREGVLNASGDYVLFLDADMATPPHHIKEAFDVLEKTGSDMLIAERPLTKIHNTFSRRAKSVLSVWLIRLLATPGFSDTQCGFKAFKKEAAQTLFKPLETKGWGFDIELLARARVLKYEIAVLKINDWYDPKEDSMGLVGENVLQTYFRTLKELLIIAYKRATGYYKKTI